MHPDEERLASRGNVPPNFGDDEARRVRREDGAGLDHAVELGEDLLLEFELLGDGFDDDVAVGKHAQLFSEADSAHRSNRIVKAELTALHAALDAPLPVEDSMPRLVDSLLVYVANHDFVPGDRIRLGDPPAHDAAAEDADLLDLFELHLNPHKIECVEIVPNSRPKVPPA